MERRHFIQALFAVAGASSFGARAAAPAADEYAAAFAASRASKAWTLGYVGLQAASRPN